MTRKRLTQPNRRRTRAMENTTIRDFSGGLSVIDNDLNLSPTFSTQLVNFRVRPDGSLITRQGTGLFADVRTHLTNGVDIFYYNTRLIAVGTNGKIVSIKANGDVSLIWDDTIAVAGGAANGWGTTEFASAAEFNGELIVCNGSDKPVLIDTSFACRYLYDLASFSNVNTPICRYVIAYNRYLIMLGDPINPDRIHISNVDTSGTWVGDGAPNDATYIDIGSIITKGSAAILGAHPFRDWLVVGCEDQILLGALGIYDGSGNHTPSFNDPIAGYGCFSHRAMQSLGDDMLFLDSVGVPTLNRALFTNTIRPSRASQLIDPEVRERVESLTQFGLTTYTWSIYDRSLGQYMLFVPDADDPADSTKSHVYVYTSIPALKVKAWTTYAGWNFVGGAVTQLGRVFFLSYDAKVYIQGSALDTIEGDFVGDTAKAADGLGVALDFTWETPWADFGHRVDLKTLRFLKADIKGTAAFTLQTFIDNYYLDSSGPGEPYSDGTLHADGYGFQYEDPFLLPQLSADFLASDNSTDSGRRTNSEQLWAWKTPCRLAKLRITGSDKRPLHIIDISLMYTRGGIR